MLTRLLKDMYGRIPVVRDYLQLGESFRDAVDLQRKLQEDLTDLRSMVRDVRFLLHSIHTSNMIGMLDFDLANHPRFTDRKRLLSFSNQVCSQNGEDGMIREIFRRIGTSNRIFAEIGVGDGSENNTAFLLSQGWTGAWIDGNRAFLEVVERRPDLMDGCLKAAAALVTRDNAAELFENLGVPDEFDILSLDIDQNTYYVWEGLARYCARVVVVEYNATIPPDTVWRARYDPARSWDGTSNFGASLKAYELLGRRLGYCLVGCDFTGTNAFFVRDDLVADSFAEPFTSENHYEPPRYATLHRRSHRSAILDRMPAP